jgi:hypothetical protein
MYTKQSNFENKQLNKQWSNIIIFDENRKSSFRNRAKHRMADGQFLLNSSRSINNEALVGFPVLSARSVGPALSSRQQAKVDGFCQDLSDSISDIEGKLQIILIKQNELNTRVLKGEREKLELEHKLNQKSELFEQLNTTMQCMSQQSSALIQAQMERIGYLESTLEPERQAAQMYKTALSEKNTECSLLQEALEELEKEKAQEQEKIKTAMFLKAELTLAEKMEAERKVFLKELERVQEHVKVDLMRSEQVSQSREHLELRAALVHLQSVCAVYDDLVLFLEGHTDKAGSEKIKDTYRNLHLASRMFISSLAMDSAVSSNEFRSFTFSSMGKREMLGRNVETMIFYPAQELQTSGHGLSISEGEPQDSCFETASSSKSSQRTLRNLAYELETLKHRNLRRWNSGSAMYDGHLHQR